jgi:hypothetical protein
MPTAPIPQMDEKRSSLDAKPFLATHRATSVCTRELARLTDDVVGGVASLLGEGAEHKPVVRRSPGRCIVQLGPVAATVTWFRGNLDSVEGGELLVVVWRGDVAPSREHHPERAVLNRAPSSATAIWEQTFRPRASNEATWEWVSTADSMAGGLTSGALAVRCLGELQAAHAACAAEPRVYDTPVIVATPPATPPHATGRRKLRLA